MQIEYNRKVGRVEKKHKLVVVILGYTPERTERVWERCSESKTKFWNIGQLHILGDEQNHIPKS